MLIYASVATPNKRRNARTESAPACAPHGTQVATLQAALIDKGVQEGEAKIVHKWLAAKLSNCQLIKVCGPWICVFYNSK